MSTKLEAERFATDRGEATLEYIGAEGSRVWQWTFADGSTETQPNVPAMLTFKAAINAKWL